jgi:hypothetical protein
VAQYFEQEDTGYGLLRITTKGTGCGMTKNPGHLSTYKSLF